MMVRRIIACMVLGLVVVGCSPDEAGLPTAETASETPAETTEEAVEDAVEEPVDNPDVTAVAPAGSVDLGELTPEADGEDDLIVQPAPGVPDREVQMVQIAAEDLADYLGIDVGEVTLVEAVSREWPDSGLGCPDPDLIYAAVITPGYEITLKVGGENYRYHTDMGETVVLCVDGVPVED